MSLRGSDEKEQQEDEGEEGREEQLSIFEEQRVWKKNAPILYDWLSTYSLEWPSLTVQWLPEVGSSGRAAYDAHRLILGTQTSEGEPNYLLIAEVDLPSIDAEVEMTDIAVVARLDATPSIKTRIVHEGEVNRARYMPQNTNMIATKSSTSSVFVFDTSHNGQLPDLATPSPQFRCVGHSQEGFALEWCPHKAGRLLSGSFDGGICLWDVVQSTSDVHPLLHVPNAHKGAVEDVDWHKQYNFLFGSAGDDGHIFLWDERQNTKAPSNIMTKAHHGSDVHCLSFNSLNEFLFASGGADGSVSLWDLRRLRTTVNNFDHLHKLDGHCAEIIALDWDPLCESRLASGGSDRRVIIWDIEKIGDEQTTEDAEDNVPPELVFSHGGHTSRVNDVSWNPNEERFFASVDHDNGLQIWQASNEFFDPVDGDDNDDKDIENKAAKRQKSGE